jgi:hypothetical protein
MHKGYMSVEKYFHEIGISFLGTSEAR